MGKELGKLGSARYFIPGVNIAAIGSDIARDVGRGSPQEQAYGRHAQSLADLIAGKTGSGMERYRSIQPNLDNIKQLLGQVHGTQSAAVSANIGDSLARHGVAKGHDRSGAFTSAQAPATAAYLSSLADVEGMDIQTLLSLLAQEDATIAQLLGIQSGAIGGMKSTTATGDWLGIFQTLANIGSGVAKGVTGTGG
jgi:hypothetical protein